MISAHGPLSPVGARGGDSPGEADRPPAIAFRFPRHARRAAQCWFVPLPAPRPAAVGRMGPGSGNVYGDVSRGSPAVVYLGALLTICAQHGGKGGVMPSSSCCCGGTIWKVLYACECMHGKRRRNRRDATSRCGGKVGEAHMRQVEITTSIVLSQYATRHEGRGRANTGRTWDQRTRSCYMESGVYPVRLQHHVAYIFACLLSKASSRFACSTRRRFNFFPLILLGISFPITIPPVQCLYRASRSLRRSWTPD